MNVVEKLRNVNLRPTKQRILLAKQILDGKNKHFTAETIQKEVLSTVSYTHLTLPTT